nr:uncharacterized protein LOC129031396 isoform X2 [Pongo pygmaeus]
MTDLPKVIKLVRARAGFYGSHYLLPSRSPFRIEALLLQLLRVPLADSPQLSPSLLIALYALESVPGMDFLQYDDLQKQPFHLHFKLQVSRVKV